MMNKVIYNKLVRDKIPDILEQKNKQFSFSVMSDEEYKEKLLEKLQEEVSEFLLDPCVEELADIQEVLSSITETMGFLDSDVQATRAKKLSSRGAFKEKYILDFVLEG